LNEEIDKGDFYEIKYLIEHPVEAKYYKTQNKLSLLLLFIDFYNNIEKVKFHINISYRTISMN